MHLSTKIFVSLAGLLHVVFFLMESVFFMNEKIYTRFRFETLEQAEIVQGFAYNQGWYNLFLAIAAFIGVFGGAKLKPNVANTLAMYACASMLGAALVLITSSIEMARAAMIQGLPPLIAIITFLMFKKKQTQ